MKFDCGEPEWKIRERHWKAEQKWHRWFAWHPVRLSDHECRWLEVVERKRWGIDWQYRAVA